MKRSILLFLFVFAVAISNIASAQTCIPDHTGYTVVPDSGILLPFPLPHAQVGVPYQQALTFGIPGHAMGFEVHWIKYNHLANYITTNTWTIVDSAGGTAFPNWPFLTWHCATLTGTPATAGTDSIVIVVDANINLGGFPYTQTNVNGFTLPLVVDVATYINNDPGLTSKLIEGHPNPFSSNTQIGIMAPVSQKAILNVFSVTGQWVYTETKTLQSGENHFSFNGTSLTTGTYFYTVLTPDALFRQKLIKTE